MSDNVKQAVALLGVYTAGRFQVWMLMGSAKASCRAHVMSVFAGKRVPQSKSGVTVLRDALYSALNASGDCLAAREDDFIAKARQLVGA